MLKTLEDVISKLIETYAPERVILYGSYASGKTNEDSDIDLLIIKKTEKRLIDRRLEVETILSDRMVPLDIMVYTPEEVRFLFSMGSPFIDEILEKGRLLYMRKATENWIKEAEDELDSAIILSKHGKYRGTCFHSQQCVEKGLKALIIEKGGRFSKIHDILELLNRTTHMGWDASLSIDDAIYLNSIYKGRYPTEEGLLPYGEPSKEEAERAILVAKDFIKKLRTYLKT